MAQWWFIQRHYTYVTKTYPSFLQSSELDEIRASAAASKPEQSRVPLPSETAPVVQAEEEDEDNGELYDIPEDLIAGAYFCLLLCLPLSNCLSSCPSAPLSTSIQLSV